MGLVKGFQLPFCISRAKNRKKIVAMEIFNFWIVDIGRGKQKYKRNLIQNA